MPVPDQHGGDRGTVRVSVSSGGAGRGRTLALAVAGSTVKGGHRPVTAVPRPAKHRDSGSGWRPPQGRGLRVGLRGRRRRPPTGPGSIMIMTRIPPGTPGPRAGPGRGLRRTNPGCRGLVRRLARAPGPGPGWPGRPGPDHGGTMICKYRNHIKYNNQIQASEDRLNPTGISGRGNQGSSFSGCLKSQFFPELNAGTGAPDS